MSTTTHLTITASGSNASNGGAGQSGEISVPNTGIINHADAPFAIGGIILFVAVLLIIFKRHHKNGFRIFKKRTFTLSIVTLLVLSGLAVALPKLQQADDAQAYVAPLDNIDEYLSINSSSAEQLALNLSDFAGQEVAYVKDTITISEAVSDPHTIHFKINPTSWVPFSEAFVYTTDDPTATDITWLPVTADRIAAVSAETSTSNETYNIYYGVRLGEIPDGTYSVDINYDVLVDFDGTMQGMNQKICQRLPLETEVVLKDVRDDKNYTIMHMADDSCWMTENLGLELSNKKTLTSADTDLNTKNSWKPNFGTVYMHYDAENDDYLYYADPSMQTIAEDLCENASNWEACYYNYNTSWAENEAIWYSWSAANASSLSYADVLEQTEEYGAYVAENSICPKGWQMPSEAHVDSLFNASEMNLSKLRLDNDAFYLPWITSYNNRLYAQEFYYRYGESGFYLGEYVGEGLRVRCVLNYSGEATLTLASNTQTAETSRMGAEFTVPNIFAMGQGDFIGYVAIDPDDFYIYSGGRFYVQIYEPGETYTFYAPHTVLYPVFIYDGEVNGNGGGGHLIKP